MVRYTYASISISIHKHCRLTLTDCTFTKDTVDGMYNNAVSIIKFVSFETTMLDTTAVLQMS
jgi:hypothetical protein